MNSLQITNQNMNYISKNENSSIVFHKRSKSPLNMGQKYNYGEKVREKNNYTLYVSGQGYERPQYEERQKGIKIIKNRYDNLKYNLNQKNKIIKIYNEEENNNIISTSDNYRYKETKNIKNGNPNLKIVTIHKGSPRKQIIYSPKSKKLKFKKEENCYTDREYGEQIRVLRQNKSSDYFQSLKHKKFYENNFENENDGEYIQEIIEPDNNYDYNNIYNNKIINEDPYSHIETKKDGDYFIKVTTTRKEVDPYKNQNFLYHKDKGGKVIKIIKDNQENCSIYHRKNLKRGNYENEPYYIGNYGEEDNYDLYNVNNNNRFKEEEKYSYIANNGYRNRIYKNERENDDYECNINDDQENEDIGDIKDIQCPLHGKISIIIHKHPLGHN